MDGHIATSHRNTCGCERRIRSKVNLSWHCARSRHCDTLSGTCGKGRLYSHTGNSRPVRQASNGNHHLCPERDVILRDVRRQFDHILCPCGGKGGGYGRYLGPHLCDKRNHCDEEYERHASHTTGKILFHRLLPFACRITGIRNASPTVSTDGVRPLACTMTCFAYL